MSVLDPATQRHVDKQVDDLADEFQGIYSRETVERYVEAWHGRHPAWFYLWNFPAGFFPWSLLLPWVIAAARRPDLRVSRVLTSWSERRQRRCRRN